jgi:hypothetical protein
MTSALGGDWITTFFLTRSPEDLVGNLSHVAA